MTGRRAVFLDRDGTIIPDRHYLSQPRQVDLFPGAGPALARLNQAGLWVVVITNQSGLARGYFSEEDLAQVHQELDRQLAEHGARVDAYYHCPHLPDGSVARYAIECDCRKPAPGLVLRAAAELGIVLAGSFMVGDRNKDVACGRAAGLIPILLRCGHEDGLPAGPLERPEHLADDLAGAVDWILAQSALMESGR